MWKSYKKNIVHSGRFIQALIKKKGQIESPGSFSGLF